MRIIEFQNDDRFFLGEGLFETIRVINDTPCYLNLHWQRLNEGAEKLGIPWNMSLNQWHQELLQSWQETKVSQGGIKVILTSGRASRGLANYGSQQTLLMQSFAYEIQQNPPFIKLSQ
jgi:4-amino-4-deoxychorismate lyase